MQNLSAKKTLHETNRKAAKQSVLFYSACALNFGEQKHEF